MTDCTWVWVVQFVTSGWVFLTCISMVFYPALWCWNGILNHTSALRPYFLFEPYTEEALEGVSKVGEEEKTSLVFCFLPGGSSSFVAPMIIAPATLFTRRQHFCRVAAAESSLKFFSHLKDWLQTGLSQRNQI